MTQENHQVLLDAGQAYLAALKNSSAAQARSSLVDTLKNASGVADVKSIGEDTLLWITFANGQVAVMTSGGAFGGGATYDPNDMKAKLNLTKAASAMKAAPEATSPKLAAKRPEATVLQTPSSRKVLFMSSASETLGGGDVSLFELFRDFLIQKHKWSSGDIAIKLNKAEDNYHTLRFDDFFNFADYGVIVVCAQSFLLDNPVLNRKCFYVQVTATDAVPSDMQDLVDSWVNLNVGHIALQTEIDHGRVIPTVYMDAFNSSLRTYLYMRDDLWAERIDALPGSLVYLCSPYGWMMKDTFVNHGAGDFLGWNGMVSNQEGLDSTWMIPTMAGYDYSDVQTYSLAAFPKTFQQDPYDAATFNLWPGGTTDLYLPTWATIATTDPPAGTVSTRVEVRYTDANIPMPEPNSVEDVPHSPKEFNRLIPGEKATVRALALDANGKTISEVTAALAAQNDSQGVIHTGGNELSLSLQKAVVTLIAEPEIVDSNVGGTIKVTATVKDLSNNPLVNRSVTFGPSGPLVAGFLSWDGSNPATTDSEGMATINAVFAATLNRDPLPFTITATVKGAEQATFDVGMCNYGRYQVTLTGSSVFDVTSEAARFNAHNCTIWVQVNDGVSGKKASIAGEYYGPMNLIRTDNLLYPGDRVIIRLWHDYPWAGSVGPLYVHIWNCNNHRVITGGSFSGDGTSPPYSWGTIELTVP